MVSPVKSAAEVLRTELKQRSHFHVLKGGFYQDEVAVRPSGLQSWCLLRWPFDGSRLTLLASL